jgi:ankyrin repeat protein
MKMLKKLYLILGGSAVLLLVATNNGYGMQKKKDNNPKKSEAQISKKIRVKDSYGNTFLHIACLRATGYKNLDKNNNFKTNQKIDRNNEKITQAQEVQSLFLHDLTDYEVNIQNLDSETCLHIVCEQENMLTIKIITKLLEAGANPNLKNYCNDTPLHVASRKGFIEIVKLLLKYDADVTRENYKNETPITATEKTNNKNRKEILELLNSLKPFEFESNTPLDFNFSKLSLKNNNNNIDPTNDDNN